MIPRVDVNLANGQIGGATSTNDNVTGVVLTGAGTGILGLLTPVKVISITDAAAQGIGPTTEPEAYKFVSEFYSIPGTLNVPVWIMLAANTATLVSLCDKTNASGVQKLRNAANGTIRVLGVCRTPAVDYVPSVAEFLDSDVPAAVVNAQALALDAFNNHAPCRILLGARVADVTNVTVTTPNTLNSNRVGMVIGSQANDGFTSIGLFLGRVAATPVHVNLGKNADGALPINNWYIAGRPIQLDPANPGNPWYQQINALIDAGYMTVTSYEQVAGYYISDDPMCADASDDYYCLANGRVIDKASVVAYQKYITYLKDDVDLQSDGTLDPAVVADMKAQIQNAILVNMSDNISKNTKPQVYFDPTQVIAPNTPFNSKLRLVPKGYLRDIEVDLGFTL